jgi:hypothetical protein
MIAHWTNGWHKNVFKMIVATLRMLMHVKAKNVKRHSWLVAALLQLTLEQSSSTTTVERNMLSISSTICCICNLHVKFSSIDTWFLRVKNLMRELRFRTREQTSLRQSLRN